MDQDIVDGIEAGLREAIEFSKGKPMPDVKVHRIEVPDVDAKAVRTATGLSQEQFAAWCGISPGTLRGWEQGRRRPQGAARTLLFMIKKNPAAFQDLISS